jgi:SMODS-associated and fused to various effectors sensor domain/Cap4 dsDNA endonuclease
MARSKKTKRSPKSSDRGSLLSPEAMGGINAAKGFDFQTRYAACHLPLWLLEAGFHQVFFEGTGDVDIRYSQSGKSSRVHVQVKDHDVAPSEFKAIIGNFEKRDGEFPGIYQCFRLVCPSLAAALRPVETGLARLRNAKPFYDDKPEALDATRKELRKRLRGNGLGEHADFIEAKVFIEVGHGDLHHEERAVEIFIARVLQHPDYSQRLSEMVQPAFAKLRLAIDAKRGGVLERKEIEALLQASIGSAVLSEPAITIYVHNWTKEIFDLPADYELDWTSYFDRATRRTPTPDVWQKELLPQLNILKQRILGERPERHIQFRGKCALSTGIALGMHFPAVGGWTFEMPQPPAKELWRSDAKPTAAYDLRVELEEADANGTDLVLGLNIRGDGRQDIRRYIQISGEPARWFAFISPATQGAQAIAGPEDACAYAQLVRDRMGQIVKSHSLGRTRLFFYGPLSLSVFLGQQLTSVGEIQLFEYQDPGYVPSCSLRT